MDPPRTIYRKIVLKSSDSLLRHVQNRSVEVLRASRQATISKVILEPDLEVILACVYVGKGITVQLNFELLDSTKFSSVQLYDSLGMVWYSEVPPAYLILVLNFLFCLKKCGTRYRYF